MKVAREEVERIAALAHLDLDPARAEALRRDLERILGYVENLGEVDTSGAGPGVALPAEGPPLREDRRGASLPPEEALANAPEAGHGCFKVPRVLPG